MNAVPSHHAKGMYPFRQAALPLYFGCATLLCVLLAGCRVEKNNQNGQENVNIQTPFGGMKVQTAHNADTAAIGLTAYPGAVPADDSSDGNNANVAMSFGGFHLDMKAASLQTQDPPEKVIAFYRKDMARYGNVIECVDNKPVGQPTQTSEGMTCGDRNHGGMSVNANVDSPLAHPNELQLRSGSPNNEHIVGVDTKNGVTRIGLVMLNLPSEHHDKRPE